MVALRLLPGPQLALGLLALAQARLPLGFLLRPQPRDALRLLLGTQLRLPFGLLALAGESCRLGGGLLLQGRLPRRFLGGEPVALAGLVHGATAVEAGAAGCLAPPALAVPRP